MVVAPSTAAAQCEAAGSTVAGHAAAVDFMAVAVMGEATGKSSIFTRTTNGWRARPASRFFLRARYLNDAYVDAPSGKAHDAYSARRGYPDPGRNGYLELAFVG
jgi:hypothetical protein